MKPLKQTLNNLRLICCAGIAGSCLAVIPKVLGATTDYHAVGAILGIMTAGIYFYWEARNNNQPER